MFNSNRRGYVRYSMSVRAAAAYDDGEMPLSKWTKKIIIEKIREILHENPLCEVTADDFEKLRLNELKKKVLVWSSWHHTSCKFNRTDFYEVNETLVTMTKKSDIEKIISERLKKSDKQQESANKQQESANKQQESANKQPVVDEGRKAKCQYLIWGGTRRHPKATKHVEEGTIRGNWFYGDDSGIKKSINANGFEILTYL